MKFEDLIFDIHRLGGNRVQCKLDLGNDIIVSIIGGDNFYGDGRNTFEVAAFYDSIMKDVQFPENISGAYCNKKEVESIIQYLLEI